VVLLRRIARQWIAHDNTRSAAAIAYYAVFTLAPTLVFVTYALGRFVGTEDAQALTEERLAEAIGPAGAEIARSVLENANMFRHGSLTAVLAGLLLLYGASSVFNELRRALDRIFGKPTRSPREAVVAALVGRALSALMVLVAGGLLLATLIAQVMLQSVSDELHQWTNVSEETWHLAADSAAAVVIIGVFIAVMKLLPSQPPRWRHLWLGTALSVVLFEAGRWAIAIYISRSVVASAYGPSSAIVAFIVWIYYSAQILLLGAEVCSLHRTEGVVRDERTTGQP
jgi:membrane protein